MLRLICYGGGAIGGAILGLKAEGLAGMGGGLPRTPFDGQYKQMVNCTLREVLRKCQNTVQNLKWKQLNV